MPGLLNRCWSVPLIAVLLMWGCVDVAAQETSDTSPSVGFSQQELQSLADAAGQSGPPLPPEVNAGLQNSLNFLTLLINGGALMIPIALMSLLVVAVALERWIALRRSRLFPGGLRREIRRASESHESLPMQVLFQASQRYPSSAARILQDLLQKAGRPIPEAEQAIVESTQREADALFANVRWLTLAAAVTPLLGLLGTVWGMIIAFYNTTQLGAGTNKAEFLAEGIYVALVTTLGGLAVAIPAAIFAHYFEGKITKVLAVVDAEIRKLIPHMEEFEGRLRYDINSQGLIRRTTAGVAGVPHLKGNDAPIPPPPAPPRSAANRA